MKKIFCTECREFIEYNIEEKEVTEELKGKEYTYIAEVTTCPICGEEVYVGEIDDRNMKKLYDEYRKEEGILSAEEIREIPKMYNISKKKLSKILGWGDNTFSRFYDGKTPSKRYSDILKELKENPTRYFDILEVNKELIKQKEYQKVKKQL